MDDQSTLFVQYENEYCNKSTDISRKISAIESLSGDLRRRKVGEVETDIREAESVIKRMDMEARSLPAERSKALLGKVKEYKADLGSLKEQMKKAGAALPGGDAARAELGLGVDYYSTTAGQRERMLSATQRMEKTNDRLADGKRTLADTEELGAGILQNLASQRETIQHARDTLHGADDNISKARRVLSNMSRRVLQNKIIMIGIILFLLAGIGLVIWVNVKA